MGGFKVEYDEFGFALQTDNLMLFEREFKAKDGTIPGSRKQFSKTLSGKSKDISKNALEQSALESLVEDYNESIERQAQASSSEIEFFVDLEKKEYLETFKISISLPNNIGGALGSGPINWLDASLSS